MIKLIKNSTNLPLPLNISYWWNMGSLLSLFLLIQILSGFFLSIHYSPNISMAFYSIIHIIQNINMGWLLHNIHLNGASFYFLTLYFHMSRGLYYLSFKLKYTWIMGSFILILSMLTAFLGYVLPWGQMSFWGATVITNLISTIPYIGIYIVQWIWGGFSINAATLNRFFSFHFILPILILTSVMIHLFFLHASGSSNPLGTESNLIKIPFNFYFSIKDFLGFLWGISLFFFFIFINPYFFSDPDNFTPANPLITPFHIQPEWYFLFAYAILRAVPNKLGGVIALIMSISIFLFFPIFNFPKMNSNYYYFLNQILFWLFINIFTLLSWLGSQSIEMPFIFFSQMFSIIYFIFFTIYFFSFIIWDKIIFNSS